jgi:tetratricopeptide (TPR) repeat protein
MLAPALFTMLLAAAPQEAPPATGTPPEPAPEAAAAAEAPAAAPSGFEAELQEAARRYDRVETAESDQLLEGDLAGATRTIVEAVPAEQRSAAQALVAGDRLVPLDREQSLALHEEAYGKDPQQPPVVRAWALEQHRAGRYAEAEALYLGLLALEPGELETARLSALRADCLLHLDRPEDAIAAWRAADAALHPTEIEQAAWELYAPLGPEARRAALLDRVRHAQGDREAAVELILLDLHWDRDLWNEDVNAETTVRDLGLIGRQLGQEFIAGSGLGFVVRWTAAGRRFDFDDELPKLNPAPDNREEIRTEAEALKLIGPHSKPPTNGRLAAAVDQILLDNEVVTAEELLGWHETELLRRSKQAGGVEALHALAKLYELTWNDELEELQRLGWKKWGDLQCAIGLLVRQKDGLRSHDLVLAQALAEHPDDARLNELLAEAVAREGDLLVAPLSRQLRAEFRRMESCQAVNTSFRKLEKALRDRK